MERVIKVKVTEGFTQFNNTGILCDVNRDDILVAHLHEPTLEYFANDIEEREVYVGRIDSITGKLQLTSHFEKEN